MNWRAAILLGLISSSFSTVVSQLVAGRIGRDAVVDWMVVASIPAGDSVLHVEATWPVIIGGILFHQWADFCWEVFFFGLLGRWTARLRPSAILLVAGPWAVFTSAAEWLVLVPLFPFWQPVFPLEQPYWIGFLVHLSSASLYPLFPWLRDRVAGRRSVADRRFAATWAGLLAAGVLAFAVLAFFGVHHHELPWMGRDRSGDQAYIRRMSAHHAQGIKLAVIAAGQASDPRLRALARLMAAEQIGENRIFDQWWRSWFVIPPQICGTAERASMPGMLTQDQVGQLRQARGAGFDPLFVRLMSFHHAGAVQMANEEMHGVGDIRLRIMAQAIRHSQQGEIELMRGTRSVAAVRAAVLDLVSVRMTLPPGPAEEPGRE